MGVEKEVMDHLGNKFINIKEMCKYYGIHDTTYYKRIKKGMSVEDALKVSYYYDHNGKKFKSIKEMCKYHMVDVSDYYKKINSGMSLSDALTSSNPRKIVKDHLGKIYNTIEDLCKAYNISYSTFSTRIRHGWTLEDALTRRDLMKSEKEKCYDHLGNEFKSITSMCKHYKVDKGSFKRRIESGMSIEDALTKHFVVDHNNIEYDNYYKLCAAYNIGRTTFLYRIKNNWTLKEALLIKPIKNANIVRSHIGLDGKQYFMIRGNGKKEYKTIEELI